jgi:alpha-1,3-rhamnosyl/mannosyltransferase
LLGFVPDEDLPSLYKEASLFIFPSLYEGFGMPVVEALSQGTAVLAERNSSLGEVGGESVYWAKAFTKENLNMSYQRARNSSPEEKNIRVLQAKNFQSWSSFTQKIFDTLIQ